MTTDNLFGQSAMRWVRVVNIDSQTAPSYAVLAITGVDSLGRVQVQRPAVDGQTIGLLINGPGPIPAGLEGQAHQSYPAVVGYTGGPPNHGELWGTAANSWQIKLGCEGFAIVGGAAAGFVNVIAVAPGVAFIKPTTATPSTITLPGGSTTPGYTAKVEIWSTTAGTWSDGATVWFIGANGETPTANTRYLCSQLGVDSLGVAIWSDNIPSGGGGIALLDKTGATVDAACANLQMDADGVITVAALVGPHSDQLHVTDCGSGQRGVVNFGSQTIAGAKLFSSNTNFGTTSVVVDVTVFNELQILDTTSNGLTITATVGQVQESFASASGSASWIWNTDATITYNGPDLWCQTDLQQGPGTAGTTNTTKFLYISTCAGAPTGVPSRAGSGLAAFAAMRYDTTNHKLWIYDAANGWKGVVLT